MIKFGRPVVSYLTNEMNTLLPLSNSGVEAGTDMAYAFVSQVYGEKLALSITTAIEYVPITNSSYNPFADYWNLTSTPKPIPPVYGSGPFSYWGLLAYPGFIGLDAIIRTSRVPGEPLRHHAYSRSCANGERRARWCPGDDSHPPNLVSSRLARCPHRTGPTNGRPVPP